MKHNERAEILGSSLMQYAPENELGVVFLFAHLAKKWRLTIEEIKAGFPDCIAYQKTQGKEKSIRIEFEFKSRSFQSHGHNPEGCDWIVCWEDNWPDAPKNLTIVELRQIFGLGFNVWVVPVGEQHKQELVDTLKNTWSVPSQSHKGDLVLFYFTHPDKPIRFIYSLTERALKVTAGWKPGDDYMADIQRVCEVRAPIFLEDLKRHRILSTAGFVRGQLRGRPNVSEYWPYLYEMIIERNPSIKQKLSKFAPDVLV